MRRLALLPLLVLFSACQESSTAPSATDSAPEASGVTFDIEGELTFYRNGEPIRTIDIEVADDDSTRTRGLMERPVIPADTGMLFVFDRAEPQGFWMEKTPAPLDIMFFGADSTLLNVQANTVPFQVSPSYNSEGDAQFVVEVPAGYARRYGLTPGVTIDWTLNGAPEAEMTRDSTASGVDA